MTRLNCPFRRECGGCAEQETDYAALLQKKQRHVAGLLKEFGPVEAIVGMEDPFRYRNKVHAAFAEDRQGRVISGPYRRGTHRVVPVEDCLIEDQRADGTIGVIRDLMAEFSLRPYNEDTGAGLIRHVLIRVGKNTGQMLVTLVIGRTPFAAQRAFAEKLVKRCPWVTSVCVNLNSRHTSMILGDSTRTVYGKGYIEDELCGLRFAIGPASFYQVNPVQTGRLYRTAIAFAGLQKSDTVLDAYCGVGTIGLCAAGACRRVIGVELNGGAVRDAEGNRRRNGIENASFVCDDAGRYMRALARKKQRPDVVFMDPPRSGSDEKFLSALCETGPERVVYISCMPETLARDLKYLTGHGYVLRRAVPFDMFPWTEHVETVCLLSKIKLAPHIDIDLDMTELDVTAAETKATYEEIKAYVLEHTGLKVSCLYIAQVKAKHGIIERDCYNKAKTEGNRVPKCPPEKERAIEEALRHFQMIP